MSTELVNILAGILVSGLVVSLVMALVLYMAAPWLAGKEISYWRSYGVVLAIELAALVSLVVLNLALGRVRPPVSNLASSWIGQLAAYGLYSWLLCAWLVRRRSRWVARMRLSLLLTGAFLLKNLLVFAILFWITGAVAP